MTRRRGFTLVELTASLAIMAVVTGGLASTLVLASRAIPDADDSVSAITQGYYTLDQIMTELVTAQTFNVRTATTVEFTVPDRDNDLASELIRYAWSGTPGDPLTRQYNAGTLANLVTDVREFNLNYGVRTETGVTVTPDVTWGSEGLLGSFEGWAGVATQVNQHVMGPGYIVSQYLDIVPPQGATELRISNVDLLLSHMGTAPQAVQVEIRRSGQGTEEPAAVPIGTPVTIPGSALSTTPTWESVTFSDVLIADPSRTDYCIVVTVIGSTPALLDYYYAKSAPDNGMVLVWSTDGGASWDPRNNQIDQNDLRFYLRGAFATQGEPVAADVYYLSSVSIALQRGESTTGRVESSVGVLNEPEVTGP